VFGVRPLQQYLIAFPNGKLQALGIAWDARPRRAGGQRWFHLYPDAEITHTDPLHWTGRSQNWNYACAACHTTNLQRNYDLATDSYATTWSEIDVSCAACHGPGSKHVAWADARKAGSRAIDDATEGLLARFRGAGSGEWEIADPSKGSARWTWPPRSRVELDTCAQCHARRRLITTRHESGQPFLDGHVPALLDDRLYDHFKVVRNFLHDYDASSPSGCVEKTTNEFYQINEAVPVPKIDRVESELISQGPLTELQQANYDVLSRRLDAILASHPVCRGDGNNDRVVNWRDLLNWAVFAAPDQGESSWYDIDLDGRTDWTDFQIILDNLGTRCER